ncbi:MAG: tetratricopeptide repeat protein [Planctomycetota bacterium]
MIIGNPFKEIIFTQRTWIQLFCSLILGIVDLILLISTYKHIKIYLFYTRALKNLVTNEQGYAREKLNSVTGGSFPYANLLAASLELENNNPKNALELLNKINYEKSDDKKMKGFSELLKGLAFIILYHQSKQDEFLTKATNHLNNANNFCPTCPEVQVASAYFSLLNNKTIEAYNKLSEVLLNKDYPIEKNALYEASKYTGEIFLAQDKCDKALDFFHNAYLYASYDNLSLLKYLYCYLKIYKLKGEKDEIEMLRSFILRKTGPVSHTFTSNEKYYYSLLFLEIGNLYKKAGNIYRAYEAFRDSLRQSCNLEAILMYKQTIEEELQNPTLTPSDRKIKSEELENLEEHLASKLSITPFEASEFLNCLAMHYYKIKGDLNKAITLLEKARNKSPKNEKIIANLSILYINSGQTQLAKEIIEKAVADGIQSSLLEKIKGVLK